MKYQTTKQHAPKKAVTLFATSLLALSLVAGAPAIAQTAAEEPVAEEKKGFFKKWRQRREERRAAIAESKRKKEAEEAAEEAIRGSSRTELIGDLKALKAEQKKRQIRIEGDLAAAKAELARRQAAGEIDPSQSRLTPARIRDSQLSELERLKAELARRRLQGNTREERVARALQDNELAYRYIDQCITRAEGDFRGLFNGTDGLEQIVDEKSAQVYRNGDRTILLQTSNVTCDVSFVGDDIGDFVAGLTHILETQGGIVETKKLAGLTVVNTVHPRGNFRLASGRKVIGRGGSTNLYTTITALQ